MLLFLVFLDVHDLVMLAIEALFLHSEPRLPFLGRRNDHSFHTCFQSRRQSHNVVSWFHCSFSTTHLAAI